MIGIYCIKVNDCIVYVGKSNDLQNRMSEHWGKIYCPNNENKYQLLHSAYKHYEKITFWVLGEYEAVELNKQEKEWIKLLKPCLNDKLNGGIGKNLTSQEFFNEVYSRSDEVDGMYQLLPIEREYSEEIRKIISTHRR